MREDQTDELTAGLREEYNAPPETPREEMWSEIQARLGPRQASVVSLEMGRTGRASPLRRTMGLGMAAAAVLVLGLGIGRMTAPRAELATEYASRFAPNPDVLRAAAVQHLTRTESLLTLVRADARAGRMEPAVASWAKGLLSQTRLLMDAQGSSDPAMVELLEDLELVLVQIVGVANAAGDDPEKVQSELTLALAGLEERDVLPRIQAVIPAGPRFVGT